MGVHYVLYITLCNNYVICIYIVAIITFSGNICLPAISQTNLFLLILFLTPPAHLILKYSLLFVFGKEEFIFILWLVQYCRMQYALRLKVLLVKNLLFPQIPTICTYVSEINRNQHLIFVMKFTLIILLEATHKCLWPHSDKYRSLRVDSWA